MNIKFLSVISCTLWNGYGWATQADTELKSQNLTNILFCIADDAEHMSAYGTPWIHTPAFDRMWEESRRQLSTGNLSNGKMLAND